MYMHIYYPWNVNDLSFNSPQAQICTGTVVLSEIALKNS